MERDRILYRDLVTPRNISNLMGMAKLFEKMTKFPHEELMVILRGQLMSADRPEVRLLDVSHVCLLFPFVGEVAQAYDFMSGTALHVRRAVGEEKAVVPIYASSQDFRVVAPFVLPVTIAYIKATGAAVLINDKGEVIWDAIPPPMKKYMLQ